jgi:hypothetical protein
MKDLKKIFRLVQKRKRGTIWLVVFSPKIKWDVWSLFTLHRKNFDHVTALRYDPVGGFWMMVDWSSFGLVCTALKTSEIDAILTHAHNNEWPVVKYKAKAYASEQVFGYYCVSAIKHLLGIADWAYTPYQLYKALIRNGGERII